MRVAHIHTSTHIFSPPSHTSPVHTLKHPHEQIEDAYPKVLDDLTQLRQAGQVVVMYSIEATANMIYPVVGGMHVAKVWWCAVWCFGVGVFLFLCVLV